jgi:molecular chaperone DnaK
MVQESRAHEAEDKKRRELIDAKNTADSMVYQTEKALRDLGDKVPSAERGEIENKINDLKSAAQGEDINRIKKSTEDVQQAFHALSQQLYAQGQPQPETPGGPSAPRDNGDDVIEGEVKE